MYALVDAYYKQNNLTADEATEKMVKVAKFETQKLNLVRDYTDVVRNQFGIEMERIDWIHRAEKE